MMKIALKSHHVGALGHCPNSIQKSKHEHPIFTARCKIEYILYVNDFEGIYMDQPYFVWQNNIIFEILSYKIDFCGM